MRHQRSREKLGLTTAPRKALISGLAAEMAIRGRIQTTATRAKVAQRHVEKLITLAKRGELHARRQLISRLRSVEAAERYMRDIAPSFTSKNSGFTRVTLAGKRSGDGAELAVLEFTEVIKRPEKTTEEKKKKKSKTKAAASTPSVKKEKAVDTERKKTRDEKMDAPEDEHVEQETEKTEVKDASEKEKHKRGGFLGGLRKFLKGED